MDPVYLTRLKLSGFRSYTSEREVAFPPGPSLTVIVGPNGFGKSTLFDAIEWALTGQLRRVNSVEAKEAEKRASLGTKPQVHLSFSDGAYVSRNKTGPSLSNVTATTIEEWLTEHAWRGLQGIGDCLQLTHFLGQSARQLFVHLDGKERWGLLEGPAGLQSLWRVEQALGRKQTELAIDRVEGDLTRKTVQATEEIALIERLQADLRVARELARSEAALGPDEIIERCRRIAKAIPTRFGMSPSVPEVALSAGEDEPDLSLQGCKIDLEAVGWSLAAQRAQLTSWAEVSEKFTTLLTKRAEAELARDATSSLLSEEETKAANTWNHFTSLKSEWEGVVSRCDDLKKKRDAMIAEGERLRRIVALEERRGALETSKQALAAQYSQQEVGVKVAQDSVELLGFRKERHAAALARSGMLARLTAQAKALLHEDSRRKEASSELALLPEVEERLNAELAASRQALGVQISEIARLEARRDVAVTLSNAIATGVAQIAAALRDEDCNCPVCRSPFDKAGQLKTIAVMQASQTDRGLAELELEIRQLDGSMQSSRQKIAALASQIDGLRNKRLEFGAIIAAADLTEGQLRSNEMLAELSLDAFLPALSNAAAKNGEEIAGLLAALTSGPDETAANSNLQLLTTQQRETMAKIEECSSAIETVASDLRLLRSWPNSGRTVEELNISTADLELIFVEAQQTEASLKVYLHEAETAYKARIEAVSALRLQLAQIQHELTDAEAAVTELTARWNAQGYEGSPLPELIRSLEAIHENQVLSLNELEREHEVLTHGRRQYLADAELRRLETDLEVKCRKYQSETVDDLLAALNRIKDDVAQEVRQLMMVKDTREQLLGRIKEKAAHIRNAVSAPLNANIERFCAALMSDRTNQITLNAIASHTSAQALLSLRTENDSDEEKNPLLYMSEGQLAAVSLCLLFGSAITYPWSRWKGLLLDDPLHHNDSIHAAAFIDVARNLIARQGYQIIVSTHDMDQAGYFLRKCSNAGIPARYWHLYGRDESGTGLLQSA